MLTTDLDGGLFRLWDAQTGQELRHFTGPGGVLPGVYGFSSDGKWVLTMSSFDTVLRIWDMEAGREVRRFVGFTNVIQSCRLFA